MKLNDFVRARRAWLFALCAATALAASVASPHAAVVISTAATKNMSCSGGVCTPTVKKAVLNVTDLANLLAAGDVMVVSDSKAVDIQFAAPLSWTSTSRLTLDSFRSIVIQQPVSVTGTGALTITTNDGGSGGDFWFEKKGRIEFWDLNSSLIINASRYKLVKSVQQLAKSIAKKPSGAYALAKNYNAAKDRIYSHSPVSTPLDGPFEGLGNAISNVSINDAESGVNIGFLDSIDVSGSVHNFNLVDIAISASGSDNFIGGVAGRSGNIMHSSVTGTITGKGYIGGLVGATAGSIRYSSASVDVTGLSGGPVGGLIGDLYGTTCIPCVQFSYATGAVHTGDTPPAGGLIGSQEKGGIAQSYATGTVTGGAGANVGGLLGLSADYAVQTYSIGLVSGGSGSCVGGFASFDQGFPNAYDYWDTDASGTDQATCYGAVSGVSGLTTEQFKSGLPTGFDSKVWGQSPKINKGYPYLRANPPPQ